MTPLEFHSALMVYCYVFKASVTSYGRTDWHNSAVGGIDDSYHRVWLAADVVYDGKPGNGEKQRTANQLGLEVIFESDHDHLEPLKRS